MVAIRDIHLGLGQDGGLVANGGGAARVTENDTSQVKLMASLALFAVTLLCGYVPVRVLVRRALIQHAMFVGAGVLLATAFCHLLPEAHDGFPKSTAGPRPPYTEITVCVGFLFMYALEQVVLAQLVNNDAHEQHALDLNARQQAPDQARAAGAYSTGAATPKLLGRPSSNGPSSPNVFKFIRGSMIVSAFSVHSIFDGVAIGSQVSTAKVWTIFGAICCHKLIIAAVVGLELFAATLKSHLWTLVHLAVFSIMSPLGIVLMVVAQNSSIDSHSNHTIMILLQSFATGTLLYIIFIEILQPKEAEHCQGDPNRVGKSLSLIIGFALMLAVLILIDDGDDAD